MNSVRSNRTRSFRLAIQVVGLLLFAALVVSELPHQAGPPSTPATGQSVQGRVTLLDRDLIVVKSADEVSTLFSVGKDTAVDGTVRLGDEVEVVLSPTGRTLSIRKITP